MHLLLPSLSFGLMIVKGKMLLIAFPVYECVFTLFTIVWWIVSVTFDFMIFQHCLIEKRGITLIALVRFAAQMSTFVHQEFGVTQEASVAGLKVTMVRPFTGVNTHVRLENGFCR